MRTMLFYSISNHPDISVACGVGSISVLPIALNIDKAGQLWERESLLP
jgi:hypothetical protein